MKLDLELLGLGLRIVGGKPLYYKGDCFRSDVVAFGDVTNPQIREIARLTVRDLVAAKLMKPSCIASMEKIEEYFRERSK